jgi:hypothetical protein
MDVRLLPPEGARHSWQYVTCGLASELVLATPARCEWAARLLVELGEQLLAEDVAILPGDRLPTGAFARIAKSTALTHLFATTSTEHPFIQLVGATADEIEHAKKEGGAFGTNVLGETLRRMGVGSVTDLARKSVTEHADFERTWREVASGMLPAWG